MQPPSGRRRICAALAAALCAPPSCAALDLKVSGHVNRMIRFASDGEGSDVQQLDNSASRSRFRFRGSGAVTDEVSAEFYLETSMASNLSSLVPLKAGDGFDLAFDIRHSMVRFSGDWGAVTMGHTSSASDNIYSADYADTYYTDEYTSDELAGAIVYRTAGGGTVSPAAGSGLCGATATAAGSCTVGRGRDPIDGGRLDILRYDTPALGPVTFAADVGNDSHWDVGAHFEKDFGSASVKARGAYSQVGGSSGEQFWAASAGVRFAQGTNLHGVVGQRYFDARGRDDQFDWYVKLGHAWGRHRISASYGMSQNTIGNGVDSPMFGFGYAHELSKPGITLYAGYKRYELDTSAAARTGLGISADPEPVDAFVTGAVVRFQ